MARTDRNEFYERQPDGRTKLIATVSRTVPDKEIDVERAEAIIRALFAKPLLDRTKADTWRAIRLLSALVFGDPEP